MSNPEYLDKTGLDELVSQTKGYVGNKVSKKIDKPVNVLPGKVLQTDSHGDPIWGEAVPQADIVQAVDDWLEENIDPGSAITLDPTLTQAQAAAQAKAVGDKIDSLKENLIVVDDDEPESDDNVVWVPETPESEKVVPEMSELNKVAGTVAKDYADLTFPVKAGTLCRHDYGLYAAKQDIPTQEAWTSGHWSTKTNIADKLDSLSSVLSDEIKLRESLADSVGSELTTGINLLDSSSIEGKVFSSIAIDDPGGAWAWIYNLQNAIMKDIPSGSTICLKAFDDNGVLLDRAGLYFWIVDGNNTRVGSTINNGDRFVASADIDKGYSLRILLSKNDSSYKNTVLGGIVLFVQTYNTITGTFEPVVSEYIPYQEFYVNNNGLLPIGIGTDHPQITEGFAYAINKDLGVIIAPGTYNLNNEGIAITDLGPIAPKIVYGYGATLTLEFSDYTTSDPDASAINIGKIPSCEIYGLTIICKNARYCIHDELYNYAGIYHHVFKDLKLIHIVDDPSLTHWVAPRTIGGGIGNGGYIEIVNCESHAWAYEDINYHSNALGSQTGEVTIVIKDCALRKGASISNSGQSTEYMNKMIVTNCLSGKNVPDSTEKNIKKISWNNSIITTTDFDTLFPIT